MNEREYDVVVLGGSFAGIETALEAASNGLKTAIIEENQMGGSLYRTSQKPIQVLLQNNQAIRESHQAGKNGLVFSGLSFDPDLFFEEIEREADEISLQKVQALKDKGVDIFVGHGITRDDKTIAVIREDANTRVIKWKNLVYAGEPVSSIPPIIRTHASNYYTGSDIGLLDYVPNGLIVYGSGNKAINVADIWSNLGARVYLVCPDKRIVPYIPEEIEQIIVESLKNQGVKVFTDVDVLDIYQDSESDYHFEIVNNETNDETRLIGSELVVLTKEGTSLVGIEALNIKQENGWIKTDDYLQTSIDNIYTWTGSDRNRRSPKNDQEAARYLGKLLSGRASDIFETDEPEIFLSFHPDYVRFGVVKEGENVVKGHVGDQQEFLDLYIDPEYGEIVGAESFHSKAKELIEQLKFLKELEVSMNDLIDLTDANELNSIIIQAAKDAANKT